MAFILCPGVIYLREKPTKQNKYTTYSNDPRLARNGAQLPPPGIQLLATCRQVYSEGREMYYSNNVFDLPPGPVAATREVLAKFQPQNTALMRDFSIRASLLDLTPHLLEQLESEFSERPTTIVGKHSWLRPRRGRHTYLEGHKFQIEAKRILTAVWEAKISYLASKFPSPRTLQIRTIRLPKDGGATTYLLGSVGAIVIVGGKSAMLTTSAFRLKDKGSWKKPLHLAIPGAGNVICRKMCNMGWERFKASITPQAVLAFERDVQKVSKTDSAYILNRWGLEFQEFTEQFSTSLESFLMKA